MPGAGELLARLRAHARGNRAALVALCAGLVITLEMTALAYYWDTQQRRAAVERAADEWVATFHHRLAEALALPVYVGTLVKDTASLTPEGFRRVASLVLERAPGAVDVAWLEPTLNGNDRHIVAQVVPDGDRLLKGRSSDDLAGLDAALQRALATRRVVVSAPRSAPHDQADPHDFRAVYPVYAATTAMRPLGVVLAGYRLGALIDGPGAGQARPGELTAFVFDITRPATPYPIYRSGLETAGQSGALDPRDEDQVARSVAVGDRHWRVLLTPTSSFLALHSFWSTILAFGTGLAFTSLFVGHLLLQNRPAGLRGTGHSAEIAPPEDEPGHFLGDPARREELLCAFCVEEERYRRLVETAPDIVCAFTPEGWTTYMAPTCETLLGYRPEQMAGRLIFDFFHPDDVYRSKRAYSEATQRPAIYTATYRLRHAGGHYVWLETASRVLSDPDSGLAREIVTIARDVTGRNDETHALRESEAMYRLAFEDATFGMALIEVDHRHLLRVNGAFCAMLGYSRSELRELTFQDLAHPADSDLFAGMNPQGVHQSSFPLHVGKRLLRKDGSTLHVAVDLSLVRNEAGDPVYLVAQVRERPALPRLEEAG